MVANESSGHIMGGHIVGAEASNLNHEVAAAISGGLTLTDIGNTLQAYPTLSPSPEVRYACQTIM